MQADLRISVKDYRRTEKAKVKRVVWPESHNLARLRPPGTFPTVQVGGFELRSPPRSAKIIVPAERWPSG